MRRNMNMKIAITKWWRRAENGYSGYGTIN